MVAQARRLPTSTFPRLPSASPYNAARSRRHWGGGVGIAKKNGEAREEIEAIAPGRGELSRRPSDRHGAIHHAAGFSERLVAGFRKLAAECHSASRSIGCECELRFQG